HGQAMVSFIDNDVLEVFATDNKRAAVRHEDTGNLSRWRNDNDATFIATADPATVLALLDELEAAEKRIAEFSHHLQCAHAFIEHTEAFGHAASNGILCCGDAQWNIDESKSALAAAGK
ncbi:ead/Ea22-like family protein, partial [Enterobacter cloacae subsp. cloacae]